LILTQIINRKRASCNIRKGLFSFKRKEEEMNFTIQRDEFEKLLGKVKGIPSKSSMLPILTCLHLKTKGDGVFVTATDNAIYMRLEAKAEVFDEGSVAVSAETLFRIIKEMSNERVSLELRENNKIKISCGRARFIVLGLPGEDFPDFPDTVKEERLKIPSKTLEWMLKKTMFAVSREEARNNLSGVFAEVFTENGNATLRMVATDGHRLAMSETSSGDEIPALKEGVIIPLKGCIALLRMARETEEDIELRVGKNILSVSQGAETTVIRLVDGQFPDYHEIMDKVNGKFISSDRRSLKECLDRASIMAGGDGKQVFLNLTNGESLEIKASSHELGDAEEDLTVQGELMEISTSFNAGYLLDCLAVMASKDVELMVKDSTSPAFITGKEDKGFRYLVMPMRT